jgi:hypothetical protein
VLDDCERRDAHGKMQAHGNFAHLGLFMYYVWRRVARYGFDRAQQWTVYLFNGATYENGQLEQLRIKAERHMRAVVEALAENVQLQSRAESLELQCNTTDLASKALDKMQLSLKDVEQLVQCGLVSPSDFQRHLDAGNYIGFKNGVYDILHDRFLPKGSVPPNVLVSMCTNYDYVGPDDAAFSETRAEIEEFYRKLFAEDYGDPNDERLAAMWLLAGSLLCRESERKKAYVLFGEGDSGKTTFTNLIKLTLGDYAADGAGSEGPGAERALVCVYPDGGTVSCARDRGKPLMHARERPPAARWIVPVEFGSTFVAGLEAPDPWSRRYPQKHAELREWAPYHFVMLARALRAYRAALLAPQAPSYLGLGFLASGPSGPFRSSGPSGPFLASRPSRAFRPSRPSRPSRPGTVYAFVTPSMPGIVKIGATTRELADRLREANESDTWRPPEPYVVACAARVTDAFAAERSLHVRLAERRVSAHREFFRLTVNETSAAFRGLTL